MTENDRQFRLGTEAATTPSALTHTHAHPTQQEEVVEPNRLPMRVCVPITAFPIAGGMRGVLTGVARSMENLWQLEYLTQHVGADASQYSVYRFGARWAHAAHFPNLWMYFIYGYWALRSLLRHGHKFDLIMAQDGVVTGAFAALVGKRAGIPVMCMDHGNVTLLHSTTFRDERMAAIRSKPRVVRLVERARFALYIRSLRYLAHMTARNTDHFLAAGDDVAEAWEKHLGVDPQRITLFPFMIDVERTKPFNRSQRNDLRLSRDIPEDALVLTLVNRLSPEKGVEIALRGIHQALVHLEPASRQRVRIIIAGDGPARSAIEAEIRDLGLEAICRLTGEASPDEVSALLTLSDIFLYTATRGINSVAVLEAMGAGCAVIATTQPRLIERYLSLGRGIAIPPDDVNSVCNALLRLISHPEVREQMGRAAREYVVEHHSASALQQSLLSALRSMEGLPHPGGSVPHGGLRKGSG